jgi:hypothetical protein
MSVDLQIICQQRHGTDAKGVTVSILGAISEFGVDISPTKIRDVSLSTRKKNGKIGNMLLNFKTWAISGAQRTNTELTASVQTAAYAKHQERKDGVRLQSLIWGRRELVASYQA